MCAKVFVYFPLSYLTQIVFSLSYEELILLKPWLLSFRVLNTKLTFLTDTQLLIKANKFYKYFIPQKRTLVLNCYFYKEIYIKFNNFPVIQCAYLPATINLHCLTDFFIDYASVQLK